MSRTWSEPRPIAAASTSTQHDVEPGRRRDLGDLAAHHTGADDADPLCPHPAPGRVESAR